MFVQVSVVGGYFQDDSGAVTVDWVALTSSVVVIGIGLVYAIYGGEGGSISTLITNYNSEVNIAADNLSGVVGDLPSPQNQSTPSSPTPTFLNYEN